MFYPYGNPQGWLLVPPPPAVLWARARGLPGAQLHHGDLGSHGGVPTKPNGERHESEGHGQTIQIPKWDWSGKWDVYDACGILN